MLHDPENIISDNSDARTPDPAHQCKQTPVRKTPAQLTPREISKFKVALRAIGIHSRCADAGFDADNAFVVAIMLANLGYRVIPCWPNKVPKIDEYQFLASADPRQLVRWRAALYPRCWSILTGRDNGVIVIDVDGEAGRRDLALLEEKLGPLPLSWRCTSGRIDGGFHIWLRPPPGTDDVMNQQGTLGYKLDVRGWHGHAIISGSPHKSGNRYGWVPGCSPMDVELEECPQAWWTWLPKKEFGSASGPTSPRRSSGPRVHLEHDPKSLIIGDGDGYGGFQNPIYKNAIQYFFGAGDDVPAELIIDALREMVEAAPKLPGRDVSRYMTGPDLPRIVERARDFVISVKDE